MLGKLENLLTKLRLIPNRMGANAYTTNQNPSFIVEPAKILRLLSDIETTSPLCAIHIDGSEKEYGSSILGVKAEQGLVLLDELIPKDGNVFLRQTQVAKVLVMHKGIRISFNIAGIETNFSRGITFYQGQLPERVYYPQRRYGYRIEVSALNIPFSGISQKTGFSISGYLFDLSRSGACVEMVTNRNRVQRGDLIRSCQIEFDGYSMDFDFSVRFVKPSQPGISKMQIGGLFENISPRSITKLSHYTTSLERVNIRKQKV
jgi:c-di-GMP-binding flagellar brake protein YcgR